MIKNLKRLAATIPPLLLAFVGIVSCQMKQAKINPENLPISEIQSIHDLEITDISGKTIPLNTYEGQVILIVNTASKCGFTPQYKDLEDIYLKYKEKGFTVIGFPSNNFGNQEPGTNSEIVKFCKIKYGVSFPLSEKTNVTGDNIHPLFKRLTIKSGNQFAGKINWNFEKFLIDKKGKLRARFGSFSNPSSKLVTSSIETLINE